jgi:IS5 family transposase
MQNYCIPTELVAFRHRIGEVGIELILKESIRVNDPGDDDLGAVVSMDTAVQEKNITYPTDNKMYKKIIKKCWKIADRERISLRQSYTRTFKKLGHQQHFKHTKSGAKQARKAGKSIKIIAGRLARELARKQPLDVLGLPCQR